MYRKKWASFTVQFVADNFSTRGYTTPCWLPLQLYGLQMRQWAALRSPMWVGVVPDWADTGGMCKVPSVGHYAGLDLTVFCTLHIGCTPHCLSYEGRTGGRVLSRECITVTIELLRRRCTHHSAIRPPDATYQQGGNTSSRWKLPIDVTHTLKAFCNRQMILIDTEFQYL